MGDHNSVADAKDELLLCEHLIFSTVKPCQPCSQGLSSSAPSEAPGGQEDRDQGNKFEPILDWTSVGQGLTCTCCRSLNGTTS